MKQKGFANITLIVVVVAIVAVGGYFAFVNKSEPVTQNQTTTTPTPTSSVQKLPASSTSTTQQPTSTKVTPSPVKKNIEQGIFGTVSMHIYGCGQPPPDGSGCDMKGTNEVVGEGEKVTVNVADKIDSYGNVNSQHTIATYYTDQKGTYKAYLNPGKYIMCVRDRNCSNIVTVESGKFTEVNLSIDMPRP